MKVRRLPVIVAAILFAAGCPLPFDYNGKGAVNSHTADPSSPSITVPVVVSYSEQGGTAGFIVNGDTHVSGQTTIVTLSTSTGNAVIFYTEDGTPPKIGSENRMSGSSGQVTITRTTSLQSMIICAIAIGPDMLPSPPVQATVMVSPAFKVTYDANGGTGAVPTDVTPYLAGMPVTVLDAGGLSLSNAVFAGWNTTASGSGSTYSSGDTLLMGGGDVTLHATWLPVSGTTITSVPFSATSVVIPEGITDFGTVFRSHSSLVHVTIPSSVTSITVQAFLSCSQLATIVSTNARYKVINGALVDTNGTGRLMLVPSKLSGAFAIPSVTSIDPAAFDGCTNLTSITFPASLSSISGNAFTDIRSAIVVVLPSTVTTIADHGFFRSSFTSITIAASVASIGADAMASCAALTDVYMRSTTPPALGVAAFTAAFPTIHVPDSAAVDTYRADSSWLPYSASIVAP